MGGRIFCQEFLSVPLWLPLPAARPEAERDAPPVAGGGAEGPGGGGGGLLQEEGQGEAGGGKQRC